MSTRRRSTQAAFSLFSFQDIITAITGIMILITLILAVELITRTESAPPVQTAQQIEITEMSVEELQVEITSYRKKLESMNDSYEDLPSLDSSELEQMAKGLQVSVQRLQSDTRVLKQKQTSKQKLLKSSEQQGHQELTVKKKEIAEIEQQITELEQQLAELDKSNRVFFQSGAQGKKMWLIEVTAAGFMAAEVGVNAPPTSFATVGALANWLASQDITATAIYLTVKPSGVKNYELCKEEIKKTRIDVGFQVVGEQQQVIDSQNGAGSP